MKKRILNLTLLLCITPLLSMDNGVNWDAKKALTYIKKGAKIGAIGTGVAGSVIGFLSIGYIGFAVGAVSDGGTINREKAYNKLTKNTLLVGLTGCIAGTTIGTLTGGVSGAIVGGGSYIGNTLGKSIGFPKMGAVSGALVAARYGTPLFLIANAFIEATNKQRAAD